MKYSFRTISSQKLEKASISYKYKSKITKSLTTEHKWIDTIVYPRADGAKRRARVLIPPGYLHPGKRKH
jgi:hypothetical protein